MALSLHNLKRNTPKPARKRVGRGNASGQGTYAGKGLKGQKARSGGSIRPGFEGGRSSLIAQTPKMRGKGFRTPYPKAVSVSIEVLNKYKDGEKVTYKSLRALGILKGRTVKIVGGEKLERKLVVAVPVTAGARKLIESSGGTIMQHEKLKKKNEKLGTANEKKHE